MKGKQMAFQHELPILFYAGTAAILFLSACASSNNRPIYSVEVNSFSRPGSEAKKTFILLPADQNGKSSDLEFIEYSTYVERALTSIGYVKSDSESTDLAIYLSYGIGDPQKHTYTYSLPVWGQTGVASSSTTGTATAYGNYGSYSETTTNMPQYGITGYSTHQSTSTTFTRHVFITVYDLSQYRNTNVEQVVWETRIASTGMSNDLRLVFPVLIAASRPFFGNSSGRIVEVRLMDNDPAILQIKGISKKQDSK